MRRYIGKVPSLPASTQVKSRPTLSDPDIYIQKQQVDLIISSASLRNPYTQQDVMSLEDFEGYCVQRYRFKYQQDYYDSFPSLTDEYDTIRSSSITNMRNLANEFAEKLQYMRKRNTHIRMHFWIFRLVFVVLVILGIVGYCNGWLENVALREEAVSAAYSTGYDEGYDKGKTDGYNAGYEIGKKDGVSDTKSTSAFRSSSYSSSKKGSAKPSAHADEGMVWIPTNGGTKYHTHSGCSGMDNPIQITLESAIDQGFGPCGKCY